MKDQPGTWLNADAATEYLGLPSRQALYQRVRRGQVPAYRFGRNLRFRQQELDAVLSDGALQSLSVYSVG